ncbi:MAG: YeeE/YedE thiosulfate transporter family protein [Bacteroidales bacterium]|nr:YeeE/YedE thiosulfate transporter family protein [Bacteroidales bacterium]
MELMAPLQFSYQVPEGLLLLFALLTGIAFGMFLEKAGFGNARKLVQQFYFTDMAMFKVLFSAIVTAMLGIYWLSYFGILDITQIYINGTYLWPQVVGGLIFGFGFVLSGLCPGTSCVAVFTGKLDGLAVFAGMFTGLILFAETESFLKGALSFSSLGDISLYELFHMEYGLLTFLIVVIAVIAFWLAGRVENGFHKISSGKS